MSKKAALWLCCLLCLTMLWPQRAEAVIAIDTGRDVSLSIHYQHLENPVRGIPFSLYRVADVSAYGDFTLTGEFAAYPVVLENLDSEAWVSLANTLAGYAQRDRLTRVGKGETDKDGMLRFPAEGEESLKPGLYLVTAQPWMIDVYSYVTAPFLVSLPNLDKAEDRWVYDVTVDPKYTRTFNAWDTPGEGEKTTTVERQVVKVWAGEENTEKRPPMVTVSLLKNGTVYDTVSLSEANGWQHSWSGLPEKEQDGTPIVWAVAEDAVEGYTVSVSQNGTAFIVTNTAEESDKTEVPDDTDVPLEDDPIPGGTLPQTGVLWWPVPLLAACGVILLSVGIALKKAAFKRKEKDD